MSFDYSLQIFYPKGLKALRGFLTKMSNYRYFLHSWKENEFYRLNVEKSKLLKIGYTRWIKFEIPHVCLKCMSLTVSIDNKILKDSEIFFFIFFMQVVWYIW